MTRLALIVVGGTLLAGCQHNEQTRAPASTYCAIARPITWAPGILDSQVTKRQIDAHNRTWKRLCGGIK